MSHKVQVWRLDRSGRSSPARGSRSRTVAQNYRKVGPAVRITFPPAVSQQTFGSPQDDACCSVARSLCHRGDPGRWLTARPSFAVFCSHLPLPAAGERSNPMRWSLDGCRRRWEVVQRLTISARLCHPGMVGYNDAPPSIATSAPVT